MIDPFDPKVNIIRDQTPVCRILCSRKRSGWWVCLFILWLVSKSFCLQHCTIISCKGGDGGCNDHFTRWARQLMTCFVWDLEPPLLRQLKSGKGIFCLPFWFSMFLEWKDFIRLPPLFQPTTWGSDLEPLDWTLSCCYLRRENSWSLNFQIPLWSFA